MTLTSIENLENLHLGGENRTGKQHNKLQQNGVKPHKEEPLKEKKDSSTEVEPLLKVCLFFTDISTI
jgi:hypothetical protein